MGAILAGDGLSAGVEVGVSPTAPRPLHDCSAGLGQGLGCLGHGAEGAFLIFCCLLPETSREDKAPELWITTTPGLANQGQETGLGVRKTGSFENNGQLYLLYNFARSQWGEACLGGPT